MRFYSFFINFKPTQKINDKIFLNVNELFYLFFKSFEKIILKYYRKNNNLHFVLKKVQLNYEMDNQ
ncbi:hypothetical protein BpHYR1_047215 [Brachionus plicatilis]|uniref:Uncharacterized protein n=1 Tax=Brachionus plicatilis TaxID=10195 RepID=A0A3M7QUI8_BRAPC|nr:hypothetical protein BpHYR1_047215 [Brachionus plicatilis]